MKRGSTLFLRLSVVVIGAPVLVFCLFMIPVIGRNVTDGVSGWDALMLGIIAIMYITTVPFYIVLYQTFTLLRYIDKNDC